MTYTSQQKREYVAAFKKSKMGLRKFCTEQKVSTTSMTKWLKEITDIGDDSDDDKSDKPIAAPVKRSTVAKKSRAVTSAAKAVESELAAANFATQVPTSRVCSTPSF